MLMSPFENPWDMKAGVIAMGDGFVVNGFLKTPGRLGKLMGSL